MQLKYDTLRDASDKSAKYNHCDHPRRSNRFGTEQTILTTNVVKLSSLHGCTPSHNSVFMDFSNLKCSYFNEDAKHQLLCLIGRLVLPKKQKYNAR